MNPTYLRVELRRQLRDIGGLFFIVALPVILYSVFGTSATGDLAHGNAMLYVTISMALYGAVTATTTIGGSAAVERLQGWGRQLGLTPLTDRGFVATKTGLALIVATAPVALVYALGIATGAHGTATAWGASAVAVVLGAALFAFYGLAVALAFRSESAVSVASGGLVLLCFLGNVFTPLSGIMLQVSRFTPMYGYAQLARYPLTDGWVPVSDTELAREPLWYAVANLAAWALVLGALCVVLVRRGRGRQ